MNQLSKINLEDEFEIEYSENIKNKFTLFVPNNYFNEYFPTVFDNDIFKKELKKEFLEAEKVKNLRLYTNTFYTKEEQKKGFEEIHSKQPITNSNKDVMASFVTMTKFEKHLHQIDIDFYSLKHTFNDSYYLNDITQTNLYRTLFLLDEKFKSFFDNYQKPKVSANAIKQILIENNIMIDIQVMLLSALIGKNSNIIVQMYDDKNITNWNLAKDEFNSILFKYKESIMIKCIKKVSKEANEVFITTPLINIKENIIPKLYNEIKEHFNEEQHSDLLKTLKGVAIENKLHFLLQQNRLSNVFRLLKEESLILNTNRHISNWLEANFTYTNKLKGESIQKSFNQKSCYDVIRGVSKVRECIIEINNIKQE